MKIRDLIIELLYLDNLDDHIEIKIGNHFYEIKDIKHNTTTDEIY